jgi:SAM-dependent methyltransferase
VGVSFPKIHQFFAVYDPEIRIRRILDIGCTNLSLVTARDAARFITDRGGRPDQAWLDGLERAGPGEIWLGDLLAQAGYEYLAYDIFPGPRTRLFDLNRDSAKETFDLVMNFGTTEHVLNQWNAMQVIHDACRPGGIIFHDLPMAGYLDHGYFNYNPMLFRQLAEANGYAVRRMLMSVHGGVSIRERLAPRYEDLHVEVSTTEAAADRKIPDAGLLVILEKRNDAPFRASLETSTTIGRDKAVASHIAQRYGAASDLAGPTRPGPPPPSAAREAPAPEIGPAMVELNALMGAAIAPDTALLRAALAESLFGSPPCDPRLASIIGLLRQRSETIDWTSLDAALRRWRAEGRLDPGALRRACDAALAGGRTIDAMLRATDSVGADCDPETSGATDQADPPGQETGPAAYAEEKAIYVSDLLHELTGEDASDVIAPLACIFSTPAKRALASGYELLSQIRTPIPGFPFMGQRGGDPHFFFLTDACQRAFAASRKGVPPIPIIAMPKTASGFMTTVLSRLLDVPVGAASLRHLEVVPAWMAFAARHPVALHDHMPPTPENMERLRASGCRKLILHVRDPRQFVLSLAHHIVRRDFQGGTRGAEYRAVHGRSGLAGVIDAVIHWELREISAWLDGWMEEARRSEIDVKVTTYEDMQRDMAGHFAGILDYFSIPSLPASAIEAALTECNRERFGDRMTNFRAGSTDEWRSVLTKDQVGAVAATSGAGFHTLYEELRATI